MAVLVTGGCGYVGTPLTQALLSRTDHAVTVLDAMWFGNRLAPHPRLTVLQMDMRRIDEVDLAPYDTIFHLANIANDPAVDLNPYAAWEVNVLAGMRLIDRAWRQGVQQFIFASSGSVYGVSEAAVVGEDQPLVPISEYNKTKMVAERVVDSYRQDMVTTIIRSATVCGYSPRMRLDLVVNMLTMQALANGVVTVLGGNQVRPNIHIDDLVDLYLFAFDRRLAGIFNAGFENINVRDIAAMVTSEVPARIDVKPSDDPRSYRVSSAKLLAAGFTPKKNTRTAIQEMVAAYRDGRIRDEPICHNVRWMKQHGLG